MNLLIKKPHIIFLVCALITFLLGLNADGGIDINIHDTYFVISNFHLATLISLLFGVIGSIYWSMEKVNKNVSKRLTLIHVVLTFGGILLIIILNAFFKESITAYTFNENLTTTIYFIAAIVILGQFVFLVNILSGLLKKRQRI